MKTPQNRPGNTKRPYVKPTLVRHGSLREVTLAVANTGNSDGGTGNVKRTH